MYPGTSKKQMLRRTTFSVTLYKNVNVESDLDEKMLSTANNFQFMYFQMTYQSFPLKNQLYIWTRNCDIL